MFLLRDLKRYIMMYQTWAYFFDPLSTDIHEDILFESLDFQGFVRPIVCWHVAYRMYICPKVLGVSWRIYGDCQQLLDGCIAGHVCAGYVPFFVAYIPSVPN
jgi:hypothetical protein